MTAGHGDHPDEEGPRPPDGPPQRGWPDVPPPGGLPPAPPVGWGAPPPVEPPRERPTSVRAGIAAFMAYLALGVIASAIQLTDIDTLIGDVERAAGTQAPADFARTAVIVVVVVFLAVFCAEALFIWFAWKGRNWARVVLWLLAGLTVVSGVGRFSGYTDVPGFLRGLSICEWVLAAAGIVLLGMRSSTEWYRHCGALRRSRRHR